MGARRGQASNGELGYGKDGKKSSANAMKCDALEGVHTHQVRGPGTALALEALPHHCSRCLMPRAALIVCSPSLGLVC